ncbi:MAG: 16S rRNA (cytosine(967)-C(5))-methyltransferase, partial [Cyanobacteria bacterium P01_D01_bin.128]
MQLAHTATWVKPGGLLVYATCTLHPAENEQIVRRFLSAYPQWQIELPPAPWVSLAESPGWIKRWPHRSDSDGFFIVRL